MKARWAPDVALTYDMQRRNIIRSAASGAGQYPGDARASVR